MPADGLAPDGARPSAGTILTNLNFCKSMGTAFEGLTVVKQHIACSVKLHGRIWTGYNDDVFDVKLTSCKPCKSQCVLWQKGICMHTKYNSTKPALQGFTKAHLSDQPLQGESPLTLSGYK